MPDAFISERAPNNQWVDERHEMNRRTSAEVMDELLPLKDAVVIDVGCGDGWLTRHLTRLGAHVTGIEVSPRHLQEARAIATIGDERYMPGIAEDLPIRSRSVDIVIFFNSLHHVDRDSLPQALREAARVLKSGGILYVSEPLPEGAYFETMKPAHDETRVRNQAQEILRQAPEYGLIIEQSLTHVDTVTLANYAAFRDRITAINPHVRDRFDERDEEIRAKFEALGRPGEHGWAFDQPMRVTLLRRA
ncbi:MAG: class I SAM-dependent methyltransferase [Rhodospirillales bacterium]